MVVFVVTCSLLGGNGFFGVYKTLLTARQNFEEYLNDSPSVANWTEDDGVYCITTNNGETFWGEINYATVIGE